MSRTSQKDGRVSSFHGAALKTTAIEEEIDIDAKDGTTKKSLMI